MTLPHAHVTLHPIPPDVDQVLNGQDGARPHVPDDPVRQVHRGQRVGRLDPAQSQGGSFQVLLLGPDPGGFHGFGEHREVRCSLASW